MNKLLRGRGPYLVAVAWAVLCFVSLGLSGQWQAKRMDGTGLGLFVADGDTTTTGYLEADTAKVDTAAGVRLDFGRAWLDSINGEPYPPYALWQADIHDSLAVITCELPDTVYADSGLWIGPPDPEQEGVPWGIHSPYVNYMARGLLEASHWEGPYPMPSGTPYLWANLFSFANMDSTDVFRAIESIYGQASVSSYGLSSMRAGSLVGGEFNSYYYGQGNNLKIGKSDYMIGAWGLMAKLGAWNVDSLWTGSEGVGAIKASVQLPATMKAATNGQGGSKASGLYVSISGGNLIDTLAAIVYNEGSTADFGILQLGSGRKPNSFSGLVKTPQLLADSIGKATTRVQHAYLDTLRGKQVYLADATRNSSLDMPWGEPGEEWFYGMISASQDKDVALMPSGGAYWTTCYLYGEVPDTLDVYSWVYGIENYLDVNRAYADSTRLGTAYATWNELDIWATNGPNGPSINLGDSQNHGENWASWNDFQVYVDSLYSYKDGSGAVCARLYFAGTMDTEYQRLMGVQILMEPYATSTTDSLISLYIDEDSMLGGTVDYGIMQQGDAPSILGGNLTIDVDGTRTEGDHHLELKNGTAYSEIDAGETQFAASSGAQLKDLGALLSDQEAAHLLAIFADSLQVRRWRWKQDQAGMSAAIARAWDAATDEAVGDRVAREMRTKRYRQLDAAQRDSVARGLHREWKAAAKTAAKQREEKLRRREAERAAVEHVGPVAQHSYRLSRVVNPAGADSSVRHGGDEQVALMLAVGHLARQNRTLQERLTKAEGDLAYLAVRVRALEALAAFDK